MTPLPPRPLAPEPFDPATAPIIERCPVCADTVAVRLDPRWRAQVEAGQTIPIVGCGNPWHYVNRASRAHPDPALKLTCPECGVGAGYGHAVGCSAA